MSDRFGRKRRSISTSKKTTKDHPKGRSNTDDARTKASRCYPIRRMFVERRNTIRVLSVALIVTGIGLTLALPVVGQDTQPLMGRPESVKPLGVIQSGNTTIVFAPADSRDIDMAALRTWGDFADNHPGIARALAYKPSLMNDPGYLRKNPDLEAFFQAHPDVRQAMAENPGNFEAIPPRPGE